MFEKILVNIFDSGDNIRILKLFLNNPGETFNTSEVSKKTKIPTNQCKRYINKLVKFGVVKTAQSSSR